MFEMRQRDILYIESYQQQKDERNTPKSMNFKNLNSNGT